MRKILLILFIGLVSLSLSSKADALVSDSNSYRQSYYYDSGENIKTQFPVWSKAKHGEVLVGEGFLYIQEEGNLVALDSNNGKEKWRFARGVVSYVELIHDKLYIHDKANNLFILQASTGKVISTINGLKNVKDVASNGDYVFAIYGDYPKVAVAAFEMPSGKRIWEYKKEESRYQSIEVRTGILLVQTVESGAITQSYVYGLDLNSGKELWYHSGVHGLIHETEKHFYFEYSGFMGYSEEDLFIIYVVDKKTGKLSATHQYKDPNFQFKDGRISYPAVDRAVVKDGNLYLGKGPKLYQYDITKDPDDTKPFDYGYGFAPYFYNGRYQWILGPHAGKSFYIMDERLEAKILGKENVRISYEGIGSPITTIDAVNNGLYVGMLGGQFVALNVETGKAFFKANLESEVQGTMVVGNYIVVVTEKRISAFALPNEARKIGKHKQFPPGFQQQDVGIKINGQASQLKNKPAFVENKMYLPFRELFELLDAKVEYNAQTKKITATTSKSSIILTPNETKALQNNIEVTMEEMPFIYEGVTYVPLRATATLLGAEVKWDTLKRTVFIEEAK